MDRKILIGIILLIYILPANALLVGIDKTEYIAGDDIVIDGVVDTSANQTQVIAKFYNSSGALIANHSAISIGGTNNIFSMVIHTTDPAYSNLTIPGDYIIFLHGTDTTFLN
ncbi:MAG: hypothetical protein B6U88_02830 [Candidatus Aenigmarchaeota archaeon ex4484_56]|nr:MAG: hypothetical protein B6U88_02830 [Candidatus Aenigmarchaeota archaeon ex4484_56]